MRNIFLGFWIIALAWSTSSLAQSVISKGTYSVGGNMTYSFNKYEDEREKSSQLTLNPSFYYFVANRLSVGMDVEFQHAKFPSNPDGRYSPDFRSLVLGPSIRYYFGQEKLFPFAHAGYHYYWYDYPDQKNEITSHAFSFGVGVDYFFVENIGMELSLNIDHLEHRVKETRVLNMQKLSENYHLKSRQVAFMVGIVTAF